MDTNSLNCGHDHCGACCGGGSCGGCGGELELTQTEIDLLHLFAQIPFLPVVRKDGSEYPVFLDDGIGTAQTLGPAITALDQKRLIQPDYDQPLQDYDYSDYEPCSQKGSMALTARGQAVVELLEIQGIEA